MRVVCITLSRVGFPEERQEKISFFFGWLRLFVCACGTRNVSARRGSSLFPLQDTRVMVSRAAREDDVSKKKDRVLFNGLPPSVLRRYLSLNIPAMPSEGRRRALRGTTSDLRELVTKHFYDWKINVPKTLRNLILVIPSAGEEGSLRSISPFCAVEEELPSDSAHVEVPETTNSESSLVDGDRHCSVSASSRDDVVISNEAKTACGEDVHSGAGRTSDCSTAAETAAVGDAVAEVTTATPEEFPLVSSLTVDPSTSQQADVASDVLTTTSCSTAVSSTIAAGSCSPLPSLGLCQLQEARLAEPKTLQAAATPSKRCPHPSVSFAIEASEVCGATWSQPSSSRSVPAEPSRKRQRVAKENPEASSPEAQAVEEKLHGALLTPSCRKRCSRTVTGRRRKRVTYGN